MYIRERLSGDRPGKARKGALLVSLFAFFPLSLGCGGEQNGREETETPGPAAAAAQSELSEWELENGIGPFTSDVELGAIDPTKVARGEEIFTLKCSACHKLDERYVAPPLREVTERRTPAFILNMMLNSFEMTQKHPTVRELLAEYYTPMTDQGLTEEDARAVLDYLRQALADGPAASD